MSVWCVCIWLNFVACRDCGKCVCHMCFFIVRIENTMASTNLHFDTIPSILGILNKTKMVMVGGGGD